LHTLFFFSTTTAPADIYPLSYTTLFRSRDGAPSRASVVPSRGRARRPDAYESAWPATRHFSSTTRRISTCFASPAPSRSRFSARSEEHTSELQSRGHLVCRLLLEKKKTR